jgi:hypothetical protein
MKGLAGLKKLPNRRKPVYIRTFNKPAVAASNIIPAASNLNANKSCMHRIQAKVYKDAEPNSPFFPFKDEHSALLSIWFADSEVSLADFDLLLVILQHPKFCADHVITARKTLEKLERYLPVIQPEKITAERKVTTNKATNTFVISKIVVQYFSPLQFTIQLFADPLCRPHVLFTKETSEIVTEFNQSPFFHENYIWSRLMSFEHLRQQFRVGNFVTCDTNSNIYRLERLWYKKCTYDPPPKQSPPHRLYARNGLQIPRLYATATMFKRDALGNRNKFITQTTTEAEFYVGTITAKVIVGKFATSGVDFVCKHKQVRDDTSNVGYRVEEYQPIHILFTYAAIENGDVFVMIDFFADAFVAETVRNASNVGIYARYSGTKRAYASNSSFIKTIAVLPSGVNIKVITDLIARDMKQLGSEGLQVYDVATNTNIVVHGAAGLIVADYPAACYNMRHMGAAAWMRSRQSWLDADEYINPELSTTDHSVNRTGPQNDVVVEQIQDQIRIEELKTEGAVDAVRKQYGIKNTPSLFNSIGDEVQQSMYDAHHLLKFGLLKLVLNTVYRTLLPDERHLFRLRMHTFPWCSHLPNPNIKFGEKTLAANISMTLWYQIAIASWVTMYGILNPDRYQLLCEALRFDANCTRSGLTKADVAELQVQAKSLVSLLVKHLGKKKASDKPTVHALLDFTRKTLVALQSAHFSSTGSYETHHKHHKSHKALSLLCQLRRHMIRDTISMCLHGTKWGEDGQFQFGQALLHLRDTRTGKEHLPHPILSSISTLLPRGNIKVGLTLVDNKGWVPVRHQQKDIKPSGIPDSVLVTLTETYEKVLGKGFEFSRIMEVASVKNITAPVEVVITVGDHVGAVFQRKTAYLQIKRMLVVGAHESANDPGLETLRMWVQPVWYELLMKNGQHWQHTERETFMLERSEDNVLWLPVDQVIEPVLIVHSCIRLCNANEKVIRKTKSPIPGHPSSGWWCDCTGTNLCAIRKVCSKHSLPVCIECPACDFIEVDVHNLKNNHYELLDRSVGFVPIRNRRPRVLQEGLGEKSALVAEAV